MGDFMVPTPPPEHAPEIGELFRPVKATGVRKAAVFALQSVTRSDLQGCVYDFRKPNEKIDRVPDYNNMMIPVGSRWSPGLRRWVDGTRSRFPPHQPFPTKTICEYQAMMEYMCSLELERLSSDKGPDAEQRQRKIKQGLQDQALRATSLIRTYLEDKTGDPASTGLHTPVSPPADAYVFHPREKISLTARSKRPTDSGSGCGRPPPRAAEAGNNSSSHNSSSHSSSSSQTLDRVPSRNRLSITDTRRRRHRETDSGGKTAESKCDDDPFEHPRDPNFKPVIYDEVYIWSNLDLYLETHSEFTPTLYSHAQASLARSLSHDAVQTQRPNAPSSGQASGSTHGRSPASTSLYTSRSTLPLVYPSDPSSSYANHPALSHSRSQPSLATATSHATSLATTHARITPPGSHRGSLLMMVPPPNLRRHLRERDEADGDEEADGEEEADRAASIPPAVQLPPSRPDMVNTRAASVLASRTQGGAAATAAARAASRGIPPPRRPSRPIPPPPPPKSRGVGFAVANSDAASQEEVSIPAMDCSINESKSSSRVNASQTHADGELDSVNSLPLADDEELKLPPTEATATATDRRRQRRQREETEESELREDRNQNVPSAAAANGGSPSRKNSSPRDAANGADAMPRGGSNKPFLLCKCGMRVRVDLFDDHKICCLSRRIPCVMQAEGCKWSGTRSAVGKHYAEECTHYLVRCTSCSQFVRRSDFHAHSLHHVQMLELFALIPNLRGVARVSTCEKCNYRVFSYRLSNLGRCEDHQPKSCMEELFSINHYESTRVFPPKEDRVAKSLARTDMPPAGMPTPAPPPPAGSRRPRRLDQVTAQSIQGIHSGGSAYAQAHSPRTHRRGAAGGKRFGGGKFRRLPNAYLRQDPFWGALNWQEQKIAISHATERIQIFVPEVILALIFEFMIPSEVTKLRLQSEEDVEEEKYAAPEAMRGGRGPGRGGRGGRGTANGRPSPFMPTSSESRSHRASAEKRRGVVLSTKFGQAMCLPDEESGEWITSEEDWDTKRFKTRLYHFRGWGLRSWSVFMGH